MFGECFDSGWKIARKGKGVWPAKESGWPENKGIVRTTDQLVCIPPRHWPVQLDLCLEVVCYPSKEKGFPSIQAILFSSRESLTAAWISGVPHAVPLPEVIQEHKRCSDTKKIIL